MKQNNVITIVVVAVIALAIGAFGGMKYQQSQRQTFAQGANGNGFRQRGAGAGQNANARAIRGDIVSVDDQGITVKLQDGSTKNIFVSGSTSIMKATNASKTDLTTGQTVMVFGQTNADGSVTAQNISLNPQGFRRGDATPSASPSK